MAAGRKTGGRQKGSRNKATLALEAAAQAAVAGLPTDVTSLVLMQAVYRNAELPFPVRMKAAEIAMPYEHPKLASVEHTGDPDKPMRQVIEEHIVDHRTPPEDRDTSGVRTPAKP